MDTVFKHIHNKKYFFDFGSGEDNSYDAFLCYSRRDHKIVSGIYKTLSQNNINCFSDTETLASGMDYADMLSDAIKKCKVMVCFLSINAYQSMWTLKELHYAIDQNKTIIPILLDDTTIPLEYVSLLNNCTLFNLKDVTNSEKLISSINNIIRPTEDTVKPESTTNSTTQENKKYTYDIFISYSRKDSAIADMICEAFDNAQITYFIDRKGIGINHPFSIIAKAIKSCHLFMYLGSANAYNSKYATKEINYAIMNKDGNEILPYMIDESVLPDEIEYMFCDLNQFSLKKHSLKKVLIPHIYKALDRN